jgi:hypothetical protein
MAEDESRAIGWAVHRQDDNGNHFVVRTGLSRREAEQRAAVLEARGHKQVYWVEAERTLGQLPSAGATLQATRSGCRAGGVELNNVRSPGGYQSEAQVLMLRHGFGPGPLNPVYEVFAKRGRPAVYGG